MLPDIFDRDRPVHWNVLGALFSDSRYGVGNEWKMFADGDTVTCEECNVKSDDTPVMIINDPFDPETPVDFDTPVQVLCEDCVTSR